MVIQFKASPKKLCTLIVVQIAFSCHAERSLISAVLTPNAEMMRSNPVFRTVGPRYPRQQDGFKSHRVQMPPLPLRRKIMPVHARTTFRANSPASFPTQTQFQPLVLQSQIHPRNFPTFGKSKHSSVMFAEDLIVCFHPSVVS